MKTKLIFLSILLFSLLTFFVHYGVVKKAVYGDGIYYYSIVRSVVIDRDINFGNEFKYFGNTIIETNTGKIANKYSIGMAILWLPFFLLAHITSISLNYLGFGIPTNGYTDIYQIFTGVGSIIYGWLGLIFCYKVLKTFYSQNISLISTLFIWLGTNLFFYNGIDVVNSHSGSFFLSALILYILVKKQNDYFKYFVLGILSSLLMMVRIQDLILLIPILFWKINKKGIAKKIILYLFTAIICYIPQLLVWKYLYGTFNNPYLQAGNFNFFKPEMVSVLFSKDNGLFYYSPILIFSIWGFLKLISLKKFWGLWSIIIFSLQIYIVASWFVWWGGASYGQRMFISLMPYFALGLAMFINNLGQQTRKLFYIFSTMLVIINFCSILNLLMSN